MYFFAGPCTDELGWSDSRSAPTCDESDGSYEPKQCNEITGECWCVGACGDEIDGTRETATSVNCSKSKNGLDDSNILCILKKNPRRPFSSRGIQGVEMRYNGTVER